MELVPAARGTRSGRYALIGAAIGGVAGVAWGAYVIRSTDDYVALPPYFVTVPVGMLVGALAGGMIGSSVPR